MYGATELGSRSHTVHRYANSSKSWKYVGMGSISAVAVALFFVFLLVTSQWERHAIPRGAEFQNNDGGAEGGSFGFLIASKYSSPHSLKHFPTNWSNFVEPHQPVTLTTTGIRDHGATNYCVTWYVSYVPSPTALLKVNVGEQTVHLLDGVTGPSVELMFPRAAQWYKVTMTTEARTFTETKAVTKAATVVEKHILCRYVRREVRELDAQDRSAYFNALEMIHRLDLSEGRKRFGSQFINYAELTAKHLDKMTLDGCTIYHDADVFFTAHSAFTLMFEQSLQSIEPALAAPYWDYTIDDSDYGNDWAVKSPIFQPDWFGASNPNSSDHVITEGRFAYLPIPDRPQGPEHNGYSRLTETWNENPGQHVARMSSICGLPTASRLPGCVELRGLVGSPEESQIHIRAEYDFHARVHMMVGGAWDCPISLLTATQSPAMSDANSVRIIETIALGLNTLWRTLQISGHLICAQDCNLTDDDDGATTTTSPSCACSCPIVDEIYNSGNLTASFAYDLMDSTGLWSMIDTLCDWCLDYNETSGKYEFSGTMTGSTQEEELTILFTLLTCHPGHVSQMGTPLAGPNDPLFWPIHGAFERVIDYLRLTGNTTHDCAVADSCTSSAENRKIRWDYDDDPLCVPMLVNGTQQIGQGWHDILPFSGFLGDESSHDYSNEELWQLFDPLNPRLTYIYDSFDWEHCHEEEE